MRFPAIFSHLGNDLSYRVPILTKSGDGVSICEASINERFGREILPTGHCEEETANWICST
jgi:hypothetical protein